MAPVACGVAYARKIGFVFYFLLCRKLLGSTGTIYRVVGVLEKIWAFLEYQPVRLFFIVSFGVYENSSIGE